MTLLKKIFSGCQVTSHISFTVNGFECQAGNAVKCIVCFQDAIPRGIASKITFYHCKVSKSWYIFYQRNCLIALLGYIALPYYATSITNWHLQGSCKLQETLNILCFDT